MLRRLRRFIARLLGRPYHEHAWAAAQQIRQLPARHRYLFDWVCLTCGATRLERQLLLEQLAREAREEERATAVVRAYIDQREKSED